MEWKEVQLCDTCNLIAGYAFKSKDFGDYPSKVLKIADINPPFVSSENSSGVDLSKYDLSKLDKYIVKKGDYILAMTGATIGKLGRYISEEQAYLNQRVLKFNPHKSIDSDFLYYVLCGRVFPKYVMNHIDSESAQPNISAGTIGKFVFQLPANIEDQRRIASILSSLDDKIAVNRRICENLEAQAQALFKNWFVDFAPFKDGKFVESELGMIPEGWRVGRLDNICCFSGSKIKISDLSLETYYSTENMLPNKGGVTTAASLPTIETTTACFEYDVLISNIRPYFKKIFRAEKISGCSNDVMCFHPKDSKWNTLLYCILYDDKFFSYVMSGSKGTKMPRGDKKQIMKYTIIVPTDDELRSFSQIVEPMFRLVQKAKQESSRLSTLRATLLPKLMSGEIKI